MSTLDNLRKEAKHWLREVRKRNPGQVKRFRFAYPQAPAEPGLRDIQYALAREYGHDSWLTMKAAVERGQSDHVRDRPPLEFRHPVDRLLDLACWDAAVHGRAGYLSREAAARRLVENEPDVQRANLYTAIVSGSLRDVERIVSDNPAMASAKGGSRQWEPILYACYARLFTPTAIEHSLAIARVLLDHGANANAYFMAGDAFYGTLVGIAGEGEQDALPHPRRTELYDLLLERGAELYDVQVLYNTHFRVDLLWWLELTYAHAVKIGREADWHNPDWPMLDMGGYGTGARFCLDAAIRMNDVTLARWLFDHGADPNAAPPRARALSRRTLYEEAVAGGCDEIAALLLDAGATRDTRTRDDEDAFITAVMHGDAARAESLLAVHLEFRLSGKAMFAAAARNRPDAVARLLDLGFSAEVEDECKQRPLHVAAGRNALDVAALLLERGAETDPIETRWNAQPIGIAAYQHHTAMVDLLAPRSRSVAVLVRTGKVERLEQVLREEPDAARAVSADGRTLLWSLPDDDGAASRVAEVLLAHGCDPSAIARDGTTAVDYAHVRGLDETAALLRSRAPADGRAHRHRPASLGRASHRSSRFAKGRMMTHRHRR